MEEEKEEEQVVEGGIEVAEEREREKRGEATVDSQ